MTAKNSPMPILSLQHLQVSRGDFLLCAGVCLSLAAGDICHLVGGNGLGKTTLLMQLAGLLPVPSGQVVWHRSASAASKCLYVGHEIGLHEALSVGQNLCFLLALYGVALRPDSAQLLSALEHVGLDGYASTQVADLSAGQKRRASLSRLWLMPFACVPLWLLDEPLTALDVAMTSKLLAQLENFAQAGGAVLLTSHQPIAAANTWLDLADFAYRPSAEHCLRIDAAAEGQ